MICGLVCLRSSGFSSGLLFSVGFFWPQVSIVCVCVCARARGLAWRMYASVRDTPSLSTMRLAITGSEGLWKTSDG